MATLGRDKQEFALAHAFLGRSGVSIAQDLGVSATAVNSFLATPDAKQRLSRMRAETDAAVGRQGAAAVARAVRVLVDGMESTDGTTKDGDPIPDKRHRRDCANDLLDRFGFARGSKVALDAVVNYQAMSDEEAIATLDRMLERQGDQ